MLNPARWDFWLFNELSPVKLMPILIPLFQILNFLGLACIQDSHWCVRNKEWFRIILIKGWKAAVDAYFWWKGPMAKEAQLYEKEGEKKSKIKTIRLEWQE